MKIMENPPNANISEELSRNLPRIGLFTPPPTGGDGGEFGQNSTPFEMAWGGVIPPGLPSRRGGSHCRFGGESGGSHFFGRF